MNSDCSVKENCSSLEKEMCWYCKDYSLYDAINPKIKSPAQIAKKLEKQIAKKDKKESTASQRGKRAKKKGYEGENEIVHLLEKYNIQAKRIPLSGALKGDLSGDIKCTIPNIGDKKIESKRRKDGFKEDYKYLEQDECDYVFKRADRKGWIVEMRFEEWLNLVLR